MARNRCVLDRRRLRAFIDDVESSSIEQPKSGESAFRAEHGGPSATAAATAAAPVVVSAGTVLSATIDQALSSKTSNTGDRFEASLAEPITVNGQEVLPAGTRMSGVVTDSKSAGRFKGNATLGLALDSIRVGDKRYHVEISIIGQSSKGLGKRTGVGAGGGAALGAIVGAIAGGGKGAAIGALAGGGAGSAGAAFAGNATFRFPRKRG